MKYRIMTGVVVIPLMIVLTTTPAHAIFGSILAGIQRAKMIVNQGIQIYKQTTSKITLDRQLTELTSQFAHLKDQALGGVGALTDPFTDLASPARATARTGLSWKDDFTGTAAELASSVEAMGETGKSFRESWRGRLTAADTVTESDIMALFGDYRPEVGTEAAARYREAREAGDKRLVLDHAMSDAAAVLIASAREAADSYETLRNNTNTSHTALQQSQVAGQVTEGNLTARHGATDGFSGGTGGRRGLRTGDRTPGAAGGMGGGATAVASQFRRPAIRARGAARLDAGRAALEGASVLWRERAVRVTGHADPD